MTNPRTMFKKSMTAYGIVGLLSTLPTLNMRFTGKPTKCKATNIKQIQAFPKYFGVVYFPNNLRRTISQAAEVLRDKVTTIPLASAKETPATKTTKADPSKVMPKPNNPNSDDEPISLSLHKNRTHSVVYPAPSHQSKSSKKDKSQTSEGAKYSPLSDDIPLPQDNPDLVAGELVDLTITAIRIDSDSVTSPSTHYTFYSTSSDSSLSDSPRALGTAKGNDQLLVKSALSHPASTQGVPLVTESAPPSTSAGTSHAEKPTAALPTVAEKTTSPPPIVGNNTMLDLPGVSNSASVTPPPSASVKQSDSPKVVVAASKGDEKQWSFDPALQVDSSNPQTDVAGTVEYSPLSDDIPLPQDNPDLAAGELGDLIITPIRSDSDSVTSPTTHYTFYSTSSDSSLSDSPLALGTAKGNDQLLVKSALSHPASTQGVPLVTEPAPPSTSAGTSHAEKPTATLPTVAEKTTSPPPIVGNNTMLDLPGGKDLESTISLSLHKSQKHFVVYTAPSRQSKSSKKDKSQTFEWAKVGSSNPQIDVSGTAEYSPLSDDIPFPQDNPDLVAGELLDLTITAICSDSDSITSPSMHYTFYSASSDSSLSDSPLALGSAKGNDQLLVKSALSQPASTQGVPLVTESAPPSTSVGTSHAEKPTSALPTVA
ncbi:uncharacterized protein LOC131661172 [Vicia villosa]|uniref:uncharacterized protein LOC131661172 n=1 Tax=Vicia villosa TaxID=3911 RepID=UPI00273B86CF|nr:uncharacterized protein LOC131661172 [Vicia villosa]